MNDDEIEDLDQFPVAYNIDSEIIMHREAHFGGNFALMLDYYRRDGKGVNKEFEISRIEELRDLEQSVKKDLATFMLSGAEAEKISKTRQSYKTLRNLCSTKINKDSIPRLIAELILAEESEIKEAMEAVIAQKSSIVQALVELLRSEEFQDPLSPGYGLAPSVAAEALGKIGDKRAIISLFEALGEGDFFNDDLLLDALFAIGDPAKAFLLHVVHALPINLDNEQAAIALLKFKDDPEVAIACLNLLYEIDLKKQEHLATYLVLACEGLPLSEKPKLIELANLVTTPNSLKKDIQAIVSQ